MSTYRVGLGEGTLAKIVAVTAVLLLAVLLSAAVALSPKWGAILAVVAFGGVLSLVVPIHWMLLALFLLSTVLAGSLEYFGKSTHAFWLASIVPLVMAARMMMARTREQKKDDLYYRGDPSSFWTSLLTFFLILYFAVLGFSSVVNQSPILQTLVAAKNYVFIWFALYVFMKSERYEVDVNLLWKMVIWVSIAQLPVVLYQRFFVASEIVNTAAGLSWDAVSGTFGGGETGGRFAALALFIVLAVAYLLIQWRDRQISFYRAFGLISLMLPSIFLAEVKMAIVWLVVVALMVFSREIIKRPLLSITSMLGVVALAASIFFAYNAMYYADTYTSTTGLYEKQVGYIFDTDRFNPVTREIGRVASVIFWWDQNRAADIFTLFFGSGPGASRSISSIAVGEVAQTYSYFIDTSSLTALLWDTGLVGAISFFGVGFATFFALRRSLQKFEMEPIRRAQVEAALIGVLLIGSGFAYNRDAVDCLAIQFLLVFFVSMALKHGRGRLIGNKAQSVGSSTPALGIRPRVLQQ